MKILVVEDQESLAEAIVKELSEEGYLAEYCISGKDGLQLALNGSYDILLLDIMLPEMDGIEVLKNLRKEKPNIHVIMLTAKSQLEDRIVGLDAGADDYLTKPFYMKELLARIRAIMRRPGEVCDEIITFGELQLNVRTFMISNAKNGKEIALGAKEFQIMEYMIRNKGQILTREQITERVWGYDSNAEYNNVDVYISFLRKKISYTQAMIRIKAIRGIGYTLEEVE
jgi:DNA-binding response OmpR family regulator